MVVYERTLVQFNTRTAAAKKGERWKRRLQLSLESPTEGKERESESDGNERKKDKESTVRGG